MSGSHPSGPPVGLLSVLLTDAIADDEPIEVFGGYLAVGSLEDAGYEPVPSPH